MRKYINKGYNLLKIKIKSMKKYVILGVIGLMLVFSFGSVLAAKPAFQGGEVTNPVTNEVKNTISIPSQAVGIAPGLFEKVLLRSRGAGREQAPRGQHAVGHVAKVVLDDHRLDRRRGKAHDPQVVVKVVHEPLVHPPTSS